MVTLFHHQVKVKSLSRVWLLATPRAAAYQAPPSLGFSRQEHWSGLHFLLQCMKMKSESEVAQLCLTLSDPMDCSLPGSSVRGIFQTRVLEWGATKLNEQGDNIQPWHTPFSIWNQSVVPCPVLTVTSWPAYRFLKRHSRWFGIPICFRIFHSLLWSTQSKALA